MATNVFQSVGIEFGGAASDFLTNAQGDDFLANALDDFFIYQPAPYTPTEFSDLATSVSNNAFGNALPAVIDTLLTTYWGTGVSTNEGAYPSGVNGTGSTVPSETDSPLNGSGTGTSGVNQPIGNGSQPPATGDDQPVNGSGAGNGTGGPNVPPFGGSGTGVNNPNPLPQLPVNGAGTGVGAGTPAANAIAEALAAAQRAAFEAMNLSNTSTATGFGLMGNDPFAPIANTDAFF